MDQNAFQLKAKNKISLPQTLRGLGAVAVIFSLYNFLFQSWESQSDTSRYLILLGHTVSLAAIAFLCVKFLREAKSARVFMMLVLVAIPVNFAILGAFVLNGCSSIAIDTVPGYVDWRIKDLSSALFLTGVAAVFLLPAIMLAFKSLSRQRSVKLGLQFVFSNVMLLLPTRDPIWMSILGMTLAVLTFYTVSQVQKNYSESRTLEGVIALSISFLPITVIFGRSLWLYPIGDFLILSTALTLALVFRHCVLSFSRHRLIETVLSVAGMLVAGCAGVSLCSILLEFNSIEPIAPLMGFCLSAAMLYEISIRRQVLSTLCHRMAGIVLMFGAAVACVWESSNAIAVLGLALGLSCLGHTLRDKSVMVYSVVCFLVTLASFISDMPSWFDLNLGLSLGFVGILAIIASAMIETKGGEIREGFIRYRQRFES